MAAVAGLVLAGCNKEIVLPQEGSLDMTVTASIGDLTKVAYDGASTTFQTGDQIAVWAWIGASDVLPQTFVVDGIVNTRDESGKWVPATQMLWKNVKDEHYFMAVHPVPASAIANLSAVPYAVDNTNYEASDLLLATNLEGLTASSKTVDLTFTHAMAKLQVNLKFRNQFGPGGPAPESVTAALEAKASAKVNYLTKVATPTGTVAPVAMALAATAEGYDMSFSGIQIPQAATKIVVTVGETTFSYTHPEALPLVPGKVTTLGFNVGQDVILLESVSVNDWVSDEPITGGEAELYISPKKVTEATAEDIGKVVGADGIIYGDADAATTASTTAVAMICYVNGNHGLALALADDGQMNWITAISTCEAKTPTVTDCIWKLASEEEWQKMIDAAGSRDALRDGFSSVGGSNLQSSMSSSYWSSTQKDAENARSVGFHSSYGGWGSATKTISTFYARACLEF